MCIRDRNNSSNVKDIKILWPEPIEFEILGLKSIGYKDKVIFPLIVDIEDNQKQTNLNLNINIDLENILDSIKSFKSLPHRIEKIASLDNVDWYNDSKCSIW